MSENSNKNVLIGLINLGCPKNLVDSEAILGFLQQDKSFTITDDLEQAGIMLINTCAFIKEAKEESIDLILELAKLKEDNPGKKLIVIGCLVQRYLPQLLIDLPEVDLWVTLPEIPKLPQMIKNLLAGKPLPSASPSPDHFLYDHLTPRARITPDYYAYIKIAEGCSNICSYCAVPQIKGSYRSRPPDSIIAEARNLIIQGTKEINLIAQDTTSYGRDLPGNKTDLTQLLRQLGRLADLSWLRILYLHPAYLTKELIQEISRQEKICNYIDLPLQHIDDRILSLMGRKIDSTGIKQIIRDIRAQIPQVVLRTSFIVGFPGETEKEFTALLRFMEETKFERLGVFTYSAEEGTPAEKMAGQVPEKIKQQRFHQAMALQQEIAREVNKKFIGQTLDVLVEGNQEKKPAVYLGRGYADAPEVDGLVYVNSNRTLQTGEIVPVKITDTLEYDLVGKFINEDTEHSTK